MSLEVCSVVNIESNANEKLKKLEGIFIVCLIRLGEALQTRGQGYPYGWYKFDSFNVYLSHSLVVYAPRDIF